MPQPTTLHHLLNTSWTLHRLSPLHHGKEFHTLIDNPAALNTYATRLRDQLTGDVLAGLQAVPALAGDDEGLSKTGALKTCSWESIGMSLNENNEDNEMHGILVALEYENAVYKAVLLPGLGPARENTTSITSTASTERKGSTHLPLLMTRLPTALRQTVISFLSTNFDTYCSAFRLPSNFMCAGLDVYVGAFLSSDYGDDGTLEDVVKDMHLTLSFSPSIAPALRSLNIAIPRASFGEFLRNSPTTPANSNGNPFLSNLSAYIEKHLSMKLDLGASSTAQPPAKKHMRLSKIACGGFVLGSEGRMKLVALSERKAAAGDGDEDGDGEEARVRTGREKLELRGSEALLRTIMRRVVAGDGQIR